MRDDPNRDGHNRSKREEPPRISREDGSRSARDEGRLLHDETRAMRDDNRGARDTSHRSSAAHINGTASPHLPRKPLPSQSQTLELSTRNGRREREEPRQAREEQQQRSMRDGPPPLSSRDGPSQDRGRHLSPPRGYQDDYSGSRIEDHRSSQRKDNGAPTSQRRDELRQRTPPPPSSSTFIPQHPRCPSAISYPGVPSQRRNLCRRGLASLLTGLPPSAVGARAYLV